MCWLYLSRILSLKGSHSAQDDSDIKLQIAVTRAVSNEHELGSPQEQILLPESLCN